MLRVRCCLASVDLAKPQVVAGDRLATRKLFKNISKLMYMLELRHRNGKPIATVYAWCDGYPQRIYSKSCVWHVNTSCASGFLVFFSHVVVNAFRAVSLPWSSTILARTCCLIHTRFFSALCALQTWPCALAFSDSRELPLHASCSRCARVRFVAAVPGTQVVASNSPI